MSNSDFGPIFDAIVNKIDNPIVLGWVAVGVAFVWRLPDLIKAIGEVVRLDRSNKAEIDRKQALLEEELRNKIARRRSRELRYER